MHTKPIYKKSQIAAAFTKAAQSYDKYALLQRNVGLNLLNYLRKIFTHPTTIIDLGGGTGYFSQQLFRHFFYAEIFLVDIATNMLRVAQMNIEKNASMKFICSDADSLPFRSQSIDLIFSNLMLQWSPNLQHTLHEIARVLKPNGVLLFSTLGPNTLHELRTSWAEVDSTPHVHEFVAHDELMKQLAVAELRIEKITVESRCLLFSSVHHLMHELKLLGANNLSIKRHRGLMSTKKFARMLRAYEKFRTVDAQFPATYEIFYGLVYAKNS